MASAYTVCLIEGDGIGHEVVPAGRRLLEALGLELRFVTAEAGWDTFLRRGTALPDETVDAVRHADATLFGAVSSPLQPVEGYRSPIIALRRALDLYANLRPARSLLPPPKGPARQPSLEERSSLDLWEVGLHREGVDLLIVRENSEGLYAGRERRDADEAVTERVITRRASTRIARMAFELARSRRRLVTIVHKANVLRATCGLFREAAFAVAAEYPDVRAEEMLVDAAAMRLVSDPARFDVIVTTNLFGDILSDEAAALVGGLGLAPSANIGEHAAIFEPVHGSAPDIAGRGIANPMATFLAVAMLLDYFKEAECAGRVRAAVEDVLRSDVRTPDLGGSASTEDVTEAVLNVV